MFLPDDDDQDRGSSEDAAVPEWRIEVYKGDES
jgi:hypothetical protein